MSGGLFNSPPGTPPTRRKKSSFEEGQDSILDLLREPDEALVTVMAVILWEAISQQFETQAERYAFARAHLPDIGRALAAALKERADDI